MVVPAKSTGIEALAHYEDALLLEFDAAKSTREFKFDVRLDQRRKPREQATDTLEAPFS